MASSVLEINFTFPIKLSVEIEEIKEGQRCLKTNKPLITTDFYCILAMVLKSLRTNK